MNDDQQHHRSCDQKAAELGFDLTKQFMTLALAGIAFVVGLSFNKPGSVSTVFLWLTIIVLGLSVVLGLVFLMRGVGIISQRKTYDIYEVSLRILATLQILLVLTGVLLMIPILLSNGNHSHVSPTSSNAVHVTMESGKTVDIPIGSTSQIEVNIKDDQVSVKTTGSQKP